MNLTFCQPVSAQIDELDTGFNCKIAEAVCLGSTEPGPGFTSFQKIRTFTVTDDCGKTTTCSVTYTWNEEGDQTGGATASAPDAGDETLKGVEIDFTAYPVPFDKEVNIKLDFEFDTDATIEVYDTKGLLVMTQSVPNLKSNNVETVKLDLSRGGDQVFYVTVHTNQGSVTKKIVSSGVRDGTFRFNKVVLAWARNRCIRGPEYGFLSPGWSSFGSLGCIKESEDGLPLATRWAKTSRRDDGEVS